MGKKIFFSIFLIFTLGACAFASSLNFQIVQHNSSLSKVSESALIIEDEMLNYFFAKGYIVSNSEAAISSSENDDEKLWTAALLDSTSGSSNIFFQIHLYFFSGSEDSQNVSLGCMEKVICKGINIKTGKSYNNSVSVNKPVGKDGEEYVRKFAFELANQIDKGILILK